MSYNPLNPNGQATMANSSPVVIASNQSALPITTIIPGTGATNLGKAEDAAHTTGDVGVMALSVRNDTGAVLAGSDGDYVPFTTDATGALRVDVNGTVSSNNSSTATLTSGSVFTGTSDDALIYNEIRVSVISNVASATDGLSIQQSSDNTNWDIIDVYTIAAATAKTFAVPRQARYVRIVYTNGGTNQASFRLQTILNRIATSASSQRSSDAYTNETDLEEVWAFNSLYNGTTWDRMRGDTTNGLDVDVTRLSSLVAGAAVIGKVGIDQTTPGTTNLVALTAETTKVIGTVNQGTSPWVTSNATTSVVGNGAAATAQRVTLANDSTGILGTVGTVTTVTTLTGTTTLTPGTGATNLGKAEDAAHASGDVGVMALAVRSDTAASTGGTTGDYQPPITNNIGALWVAGAASTNGGWLVATGSIAATKTDIGTANTPGQVAGWYIYNPNATVAYVQFFNTQASGVTLGTTAPVYSLGIPATSGANVAPGMVGITHATAISIAVTTTRAGLTGTGSTVDYNIWYKQ